MASVAYPNIPDESLAAVAPAVGSPKSAVSWAAIIAGAVVASATSLVLLILGSGLGLALASPWSAPSVTSFTVMAGVWFIVIQWAASAIGGYITGRLRTRWIDLHTHEVFFRDTAHGFLAWSLSTVLVAALLIAAGSSALGGGSRDASAPNAYALDALFRSTQAESADPAPTRAEAARILARAAANGGLTADDRHYLGAVVAARTGVSVADGEARVDDAVTAVKTATDSARKAASATALFTALAMVIGAFIASVAAALGGQLRDEHP